MELTGFILVVEDSPTQARQIEETLKRAGYRCRLAFSGREALGALENERPLLVLADIVMPEMDGFELCKAMKSAGSLKGVPVILLTQLSDPKEVVRGMECGADDFVVKPYNEKALLARIEGALCARREALAADARPLIIVAEDSPTQAEQLRFMLERAGYSVELASNGQECLDLAARKTPSLIISDVMMPVMDGFELAWRVKSDDRLSSVPVVLITSLMERKDSVQRAPVAADAFFTKPFEEARLLAKVEELAGAKKGDEDPSGIEISFAGEKYTIRSGKRQILSFLLSTYENAVRQNRELAATQKELHSLNENLEERVLKRTRQLQDSEANYRRLLETSVDAIVVAGRDNTVFFMNRAAEELFGASYEEIAGSPFFIDLGGLGTKDVEITRVGGKAYAEARTVSTTWGEQDALLVAFRETTERKRMEEELLKASKLESLGTLAGGIAHDFNNLLTAIIGNLSVARLLSKDDGKVEKPLVDAENAAHRAKDLTKQLLTFSKGGLPVKKPVDLSQMIRESASFSVRGSNIRCEVALPVSLPAVEADEGQISQVIHNLVINADQAMPEGGVIKITSSVVEGKGDDKGPFLRIQVSDTGKGIAEEHLAKVFDPYFTTKKDGSGLGLATVYSIVRNHGGFVEVESAQAAGTTFSVYLPVSSKPAIGRESGETEELERGQGRILIMDDEHMVREAAATILEELGYEVEFAENGKEAIAKYGREMKGTRPFDAVIMDLTIPAGMGGKEAVRKLLELDPGARVIVSSGYSNDDIMSDYARFGFSAVIAKPYRIEDLSRTVKGVIGRPRGR